MRRTSLKAIPPFRLDLTVAVLRRLPAHPVEVYRDGRYLRAFETERGPVAWAVTQRGEGRLAVELFGDAGETDPWRRRLARALGTDVDLSPFYRRARDFPRVAEMARTALGVKPPRFQALHESFASVLLFQQVSLASAVATLRRLVLALTRPVEVAGAVLHPFPRADVIAACSAADLRRMGMSAAKARALRALAAATASGELDEAELARLPSGRLVERLLELPGVGPWSAALLALRGFGRLDLFPPGDAAAVKLLPGLGSAEAGRALVDAMGDHRGMLYYHLFLDNMARHARGPFAPPGPAAAAGATRRITRGRGRSA